MNFLKRNFKSRGKDEVEITMNSKYVEGLVEVLKLEGIYPKKLPYPTDNGRAFQTKKGGIDPLNIEDRRNGPIKHRRSPYLQERRRDITISGAREARYHIYPEEAFYETSNTR